MGRTLASEFPRRLERLRRGLELRRLDAMVVFSRVNTRYLTGLKASLSYLIVTPRETILSVDGRYIEAARAVAPHCEVRLMKRISDPFALLHAFGPRRIGFEGETPWTDVFQWRQWLPDAEWEECGNLIGELRLIKSAAETAAIAASAQMTDRIFETVIGGIVPGTTEWDIRGAIRAEADRLGAEELSFESIVAAGTATSLPHYHPQPKALRPADLLMIDMGTIVEGYCSDMTRTVAIGTRPPTRLRRAYDALLEAQEAALEAVAPGVRCADLHRLAQEGLARHRIARFFTHGLGHGVGLEIHEEPRLNAQSTTVLRPGMVVTIEPGVYFPGVGGVRIEDLVLVTATGHRVLSRTPKSLRVVPLAS